MTDVCKSEDEEKKKKPELPIVTIRNTADYQRMKLDRLMANPEKPVIIPERPKHKGIAPPPEFVRNIMGSSAGAGSGEFHVYRHIRRKEYARQRAITEKARIEKLEEEYQTKLDENKKKAELKTAKKRAKRLRHKEKVKKARKEGTSKGNDSDDSNNSDASDNDKKSKIGNNGESNNKAKLVVPTYTSTMFQFQAQPEFESSDSD